MRLAMVSFSVYVPALMSMRTCAVLPLAIELTAACTVVNCPLPSLATVIVCVMPDGQTDGCRRSRLRRRPSRRRLSLRRPSPPCRPRHHRRGRRSRHRPRRRDRRPRPPSLSRRRPRHPSAVPPPSAAGRDRAPAACQCAGAPAARPRRRCQPLHPCTRRPLRRRRHSPAFRRCRRHPNGRPSRHPIRLPSRPRRRRTLQFQVSRSRHRRPRNRSRVEATRNSIPMTRVVDCTYGYARRPLGPITETD